MNIAGTPKEPNQKQDYAYNCIDIEYFNVAVRRCYSVITNSAGYSIA
jgi:hypothetical protein